MKVFSVEISSIVRMVSGHYCLNLTEKISWEAFPDFANRLMKVLDGEVLSKTDGPDIRIWDVLINGREYRLTFDDYPLMVALEATDCESDNYIHDIKELLLKE